MVSAGQILREERKRQGLAVGVIAKKTKIPERILSAIECDNISQVPSAFLYKSFAKQFAAALSIDFRTVATEVHAKAVEFPAVRVPGEIGHSIKVPAMRARREPVTAWAFRVLALFAVVAVCSGLYKYASQVQSLNLTSWTYFGAKIDGHDAETPAVHDGATVKAQDEPILLRIAALEKTWLSVESDGRRVFSGLLEPADTKILEGRDSAKIRTGNAGGVTVTFNGRQIGRLGQRGQVRTVLFTSDDQYEILQPALTSRLELLPAISLTRWTR